MIALTLIVAAVVAAVLIPCWMFGAWLEWSVKDHERRLQRLRDRGQL